MVSCVNVVWALGDSGVSDAPWGLWAAIQNDETFSSNPP
jgi:hypothetical protein